MRQSFTVLKDNYAEGGFDEILEIVQSLSSKGGKFKGWDIKKNFHITTLYLGQDKSKQQDPIFKNFEEGKHVEVEIRALVYIPDKIMTAVCFPKCEIENKYPHITLVLGKWKARQSNDALEGTAGKGKVFHDLYEKAS